MQFKAARYGKAKGDVSPFPLHAAQSWALKAVLPAQAVAGRIRS